MVTPWPHCDCWYIHWGLKQLKPTCGPHAMHYAPNWFNCLVVCPLWAKSSKYYSKVWEINAVMKRQGSNCLGILSDQEEAATASNLSRNTIAHPGSSSINKNTHISNCIFKISYYYRYTKRCIYGGSQVIQFVYCHTTGLRLIADFCNVLNH